MKQKIVLILFVVFIAIFAIIIIGSLLMPKIEENKGPDNGQITNGKDQDSPGIVNPVSVYCEEQGGFLETRAFIDGEKSFCIFADGSECEEWAFFRNECEDGISFCRDFCGNGICQEMVCLAVGCPCAETPETCLEDCLVL